MDRRGSLRASDADREQIAERLRHAATEGRIATDELEQRLGALFTSRTYGELDAIVSDLPGKGVSHARGTSRRSPARTLARPALALAIAVPVVMAMVFIATGVFAVWILWVVCGWWFFGHRRRTVAGPWAHGPGRHHCRPGYGPRHGGPAQHRGPGHWV
jgi:hypothetical protein